jgi:hypothetical protein
MVFKDFEEVVQDDALGRRVGNTGPTLLAHFGALKTRPFKHGASRLGVIVSSS